MKHCRAVNRWEGGEGVTTDIDQLNLGIVNSMTLTASQGGW
jgi:hypothetical protein